jgi:hypothetical protein
MQMRKAQHTDRVISASRMAPLSDGWGWQVSHQNQWQSWTETGAGKLVDAAHGEIARLKDKLKRFYAPLPWLTEEQKEKIQTVRKAFKAWEDEHNPIMAALKFKYEDLCRQEREAPEGLA